MEGTVLLHGSIDRGVACSGSWSAEYEYLVEDEQWWFLARSGRRAGATSIATHGDLRRSAGHRSQPAYGIGDELRGSFVTDGIYWAAVGLLRDSDAPWYTDDDVRVLADLSGPIASGFPPLPGAHVGRSRDGGRRRRARRDRVRRAGSGRVRVLGRRALGQPDGRGSCATITGESRAVMLVARRDIRIISVYGSPLRHLILDPGRDYQPMP